MLANRSEVRAALRAGTWSGDQVPGYALIFSYGLLALGVLACVVIIAKSFEDE
jgi:hypothetical protein